MASNVIGNNGFGLMDTTYLDKWKKTFDPITDSKKCTVNGLGHAKVIYRI